MIQVCTPLSDEIAKSHLIRLARINAVATPGLALTRLCSANRDKGNMEPIPARRIALAVGACPDQYVRHHTFLNYWKTRHPEGSLTGDRGKEHWRSRDTQLSLAIPAPILSYCHRCTAEDLQALGFSYWRRSHQLAAATYCARHRERLTPTLRGAPMTNSLPHEHQQSTDTTDIHLTTAQFEAVLRYQALGVALLERIKPISLNSTEFSHWVRLKLIRGNQNSAGAEILRHCLSTFGTSWMQQMWCSTIKRSSMSGMSERLQAAIGWMNNSSIEVITVIITALTSTTHEALSVLENLSNETPQGIQMAKFRKDH